MPTFSPRRRGVVLAALLVVAACDRGPIQPTPQAASPTASLLSGQDADVGELIAETVVRFPGSPVDEQVDLLPPGLVVPPDGAVIEVTGALRLANGTLIPATDVVTHGSVVWYRPNGDMVSQSGAIQFRRTYDGTAGRIERVTAASAEPTSVRLLYEPVSAEEGLRIRWIADEAVRLSGGSDPSCVMLISWYCVGAPAQEPAWTSDGAPSGEFAVRVYRRRAQALVVTCPDTARRFERVQCEARMPTSVAFTVVRKEGVAEGHVSVDSTEESIGAGDAAAWAGRIARTTVVRYHYRVGTSSEVRVSAPVTISVRPRRWRPMEVPDSLPPAEFDRSGIIRLYPPIFVTPDGMRDSTPAGTLAVSRFITDRQFAPITTGPNTGWRVTGRPLTYVRDAIYLNRALDSLDDFYRAQRGGRASGGRRHCDESNMRALLAQVITHEQGHARKSREFYRRQDVMDRHEAAGYFTMLSPLDTVTLGRLDDEEVQRAYGQEFDSFQEQQVHGDRAYDIVELNRCKFRPLFR